jgi:lysophospholipase L1-like esterase
MHDFKNLAATFSDGRALNEASLPPTHYLQPIVEQLTKPYPDNRIINIVCHGHSVPAGYFHTPEVRTLDSYPHLLQVALKKRFPYAIINVIVTAVGGEDSERGAARFDVDVLSLRPDVITIDYALNDRKIGLQRAETAWRKMIESATIRGVLVILLTPSADLEANLGDSKDPLHLHAIQVRALARQYRIGLADSESAFQAHLELGGRLDELMSHIRHPNRTGHELIAEKLLSCFGID